MNRVRATAARAASVTLDTNPELIARYLEDAAHYPGGRADAVARPHNVDEVAAVVRDTHRLLVAGAQSSLTGGATPDGGVVLSTERLKNLEVSNGRVKAGAGLTLQALQDRLALDGLWFPPVPTYLGATVGGAVSTNAAGAATFKYGAVRGWVEGLTIVLPSADVLEIRRGDTTAVDGVFVIQTDHGERRIEIPPLRMPDVPKRSAGYHLAPGMDLVDLFIGAEGTLGVVVEAELRVQPRPAGTCWAMIPLASERQAIRLTADLRSAAQQTWRTSDPAGVDLAAIEHVDRRSLQVVREDGVDRRLGIHWPESTEVLLLGQIELTANQLARDLWSDLADVRAADAADTPIVRLCRILDRYGALENAEMTLPSDTRRAAALVELRESVPAGVNRRVALARANDGRIHKTAADMIVPYERFEEMMVECRRLCAESHLDLAVWGHISDGNVHPNIIPRSYEDVVRGREMLRTLAAHVIGNGGCPLAEHGVGRNPVKQEMLRMLYGADGIDAMRRVKLSLDPEWKLAPDVLFPRHTDPTIND